MDTLSGLKPLVFRHGVLLSACMNRLEGQASLVLEDAFEEKVKQNFDHTRKIAARLGQLGGAITGDPTRLVEISPTEEFALPSSNAEVPVILSHTLQQVRVGIQSYDTALAQIKDKDEITYHELVDVLKDHVRSEDEIEVALAN